MSHAQDAAINVASTIQSMSVKRHPDPIRDMAPETAADKKEVVEIDPDADVDELSDVAEDEMYVVRLGHSCGCGQAATMDARLV